MAPSVRWGRPHRASVRPAGSPRNRSAAAGAAPATRTGTDMAWSARRTCGLPAPVRHAGPWQGNSGATAARPATSIGVGPAASARRSGGSVRRPWLPPVGLWRRALAKMLAPDAIVADVHEAVSVRVGGVPAMRLPEVRAPDGIVPDVHEAIGVEVPRNNDGHRHLGAREGASRITWDAGPVVRDARGRRRRADLEVQHHLPTRGGTRHLTNEARRGGRGRGPAA